jgi:hypothetical protein
VLILTIKIITFFWTLQYSFIFSLLDFGILFDVPFLKHWKFDMS